MSLIDWTILIVTLTGIIAYGVWKSRTSKDLEGYFLSNRSMPWWLVLLSIMGTQASAITFLSAPGQAYTDGMRFVQYYFGLPLAMVVLCITFVPMFSKLKVFTAYEFLEKRFDLKTRSLTSFLFLLGRGLSTGISIYAPSIILSSLLGWDIFYTNIFMGGLLIIYTMSGGAKAVAYTQQLQLVIIFIGMFIAGYMIVHLLPRNISFANAIDISGKLGKMNVITTGVTEKGFDWNDKYNIISGVIGGFFLALSYFGTDQSQVGRYLTAKNDRESKLGLLMNGLVKVPMQFFILLIGALLVTFYQFNKAPIFFDQVKVQKVDASYMKDSLQNLQTNWNRLNEKKLTAAIDYSHHAHLVDADTLKALQKQSDSLRKDFKRMLMKVDAAEKKTSDTNYIFIRFVVDFLPKGLVGLLIAIIFLASWGSIAAALNSLASATMIDFHCRFRKQPCDTSKDYKISKLYTLAWGLFCIVIAQFATGLGSLIEAVNVIGSLFYGVILGIFLVAFYVKSVKGTAVFWAALIGEAVICYLYFIKKFEGFLWMNVIGAVVVVAVSIVLQTFFEKRSNENKIV